MSPKLSKAARSPYVFPLLMDRRISERRPGARQLGGGCFSLCIMLFGLKHKGPGGLAIHLLESVVLQDKQTHFNLVFSLDRGQAEDMYPE
ncbi:hypothetical protein VZT92_011745 [Zoarces viviparus]|uniref:Uncharacterized protein n=1 Tax=Zoarces viviparus TaxID=48416 RepID=A0AAW1F5R5_ZOAVI